MKKCRLATVAMAMICMTAAAYINVVEDFENIGDWGVTVGSGATGGSLVTNGAEAQVGAAAGEFDYALSAAVGFDYVNYTKDLGAARLDVSGPDVYWDMWLRQPNDPDALLQLQLFDSSMAASTMYDFPEGDGQWQHLQIAMSLFNDYGTDPDLSDIQLVRFQSNGDGSTTPTTNEFFIDQLVSAPEPATAVLLGLALLALGRRRVLLPG